MKRIVLIPLLLSTFLLVGCETETELDRCIEANGGNVEFDLASYREKTAGLDIPDGVVRDIFLETFDLNSIDLEFYYCTTKLSRERFKELTDRGKEWSYIRDNNAIDYDSIDNLCLPKNRAKEICHIQGIY